MLPGSLQVLAVAPGVLEFELGLHPEGVELLQDDVELQQTLGRTHLR